MTKKRTPKPIPTPTPASLRGKEKRGGGQVWRFVDYHSRWGSDLEGLPKYIKWFINGWEGCEGEVLTSLNQLRAHADFIWLQGALIELLSRATNTDSKYQGYLLTSRHTAASVAEIGRMLRIEGRGSYQKANAVLCKLNAAGFLEESSLPQSWCSESGDIHNGSYNITMPKKKKKRPKKPATKAKNADEPFKKEKGEDVNINEITISKEQRRQMLIAQVDQLRTPTATPPNPPTSSDAGQARSLGGRMPALASSSEQIGSIIKLRQHRYDMAAWAFADEILVLSGYLTAAELGRARQGQVWSPDKMCERAHWAKAWHRVEGQFDAIALDELRVKIRRRAEKMGHDRHSKRNPESYLMTAWNNLVVDVGRKLKIRDGCKAM